MTRPQFDKLVIPILLVSLSSMKQSLFLLLVIRGVQVPWQGLTEIIHGKCLTQNKSLKTIIYYYLVVCRLTYTFFLSHTLSSLFLQSQHTCFNSQKYISKYIILSNSRMSYKWNNLGITFKDWVISLSIMLLRLSLVSCINSFLIFASGQYFTVGYTTVYQFTH